ncbi:hypothetical protein N494_12910 [Clostridium botulinum A2B7 92]|uniref:GNAT family N-acetyltransferase n=1 Tax=Clostridium botulinum TaxID=1491 RepID=UPI0007E0278A|nr:GNAT family N-acetyltransferase [Clostridium botulinum]KEI97159.1 hypothetical protein N494_12910 [Clostridium botulinum A2B7 92]
MDKIVLFGASKFGLYAFNLLKDECNIVAFADNDPKKWGKLLNGKKIISPLHICKDYKIIITSTYWKEILCQLTKMGISHFNIFFKRHNEYAIAKMEYKNNHLICNNLGELRYLKNRKIKLYYLELDNLLDINCKKDIKIDIINNRNVIDILDYRDGEVYNSFIKMLQENQVGLYAKYNGKVVGHVWGIVNNDVKIVNDLFLMIEKTAMLHFANVNENFRGENIYPYMLKSLIDYVRDGFNIKNFYICTDYDNLSSQRGVSKIGFKEKDEIKFYYYGDDCINIKSILAEE